MVTSDKYLMDTAPKNPPRATWDVNLPHANPETTCTLAASLPANTPPYWRPPNHTDTRIRPNQPATNLTLLKKKSPNTKGKEIVGTDEESEKIWNTP